MKIMSVVGARPQFVKLSMLCRAFGGDVMTCEHVLVHTGQHYDFEMSSVFFDQLEIPAPDYHLEIGSGSHGDQTGRMLAAVEGVLVKERPGVVLVFGDTNTTLAAALAAAKMGIPIGHVEAGMRSFNRHMPEEINRVVTDHLATMHFCATETAVENLKNEGVMRGVYLVGDVMQEAVLLYKERARLCSNALEKVGLGGMDRKRYALATIHRAENTDDEKRLQGIIEALIEISRNVRVLLPSIREPERPFLVPV
jgi:UDP-N-acetylglucosamine 2-epimerase